jgi:outer membrane protein OmpA-like peptidoglycan-associated protein
MNMSPKKILLLGLLAFALLSAVTLAYYLPRIQPRVDVAHSETRPAPSQDTAPEAHKPDIDQLLAQSIPDHPDDAATGTLPAPLTAPVKTALKESSQPIADTAVDSRLADLLKHPLVQFEISSSTLTPASRDYLGKVAALMQDQPHIGLSIEGHTDSQDRLGKNQSLSEARARAVLEYLVSKGVASTRMASAGFGGSQPIADNETAEGRAKNRRIEFEIRNE